MDSDRLRRLIDAGIAVTSELDLDTVLQRIVDAAAELAGARYAALGVIDRSGTALERFLTTGLDAETHAAIGDLPRGRGILGVLIRDAQTLRLRDLGDDPRSVGFPPNHPPMRSFLGVPIRLRGVAFGNLYLTEKEGAAEFTEEDEEVTRLLAAQAAVAIENSQRVARDALRRVVTAQELERRRLARELHDETGQALTSILLGLKGVEEAATTDAAKSATRNLRELVVATLQDVRRLAVELRPKALDDFGLVPALERLVDTYGGETGIAVDLVSQLPEQRLPAELETAIYRIVQEALTNVVKHARARHVSVVLAPRDGTVVAVVEDDGRGFDPEAPDDDGVGLLGMRERLALLDGRLTLESAPGAGTTLVAEVPLR